ncbi:NUDIX domain-containing protein [Pseudobacteroides cellulosolvens]|uniref:NUDIX hydrolase n=1 Tax=Pseudobacteroides cellulosolvens ATCC 35603 = DSM 2933 TaxID=398512 RepID=A0A0L6JHS1_9FIRM|nr:NUDIX hydrolase [Pseudobacteroides cellulosolvens]KNY25037.1 NUDIX hydrolase [Pseudobacteroides cellulosolvens ATCC 35603 = DSM 2933]
MNFDEKTIGREHTYKGSIIDVETLEVLLPDGKKATRDVVLHPGASVVIPISDNGEIYMVRQYRKPIERTTIELPAGKLDAGEDPKVCAVRELSEETGLVAENVKHLISIHSTPGFSNEVLHLYVAIGLKEGEAHSDEDEFVDCEKYEIKKLIDMILNHEITDAKTIIGILMADRIIKGDIKF